MDDKEAREKMLNTSITKEMQMKTEGDMATKLLEWLKQRKHQNNNVKCW